MTTELKRMRQLIGAPADWAANDLVIGAGEVAVETQPAGDHRLKIGDGVKRYSQLPYMLLGLGDTTDPANGAGMVGYGPDVAYPDGSVGEKLNQIRTLDDYPTTQAAISAAIAGGFMVGVISDVTVRIPTDAATLQIALDRLYPMNSKVQITLNIEAGHVLATGVVIAARDCRQFRVTSTDAEVPLSVGYAASCFVGSSGAVLPRIALLINAATQTAGNGVSLQTGSSVVIESGCGVKNVWGTGLSVNYSFASANGCVFSGAARNGNTGAGITAWASRVSAEGANVSGSLYYGAQAAHGGVLAFRLGNANNCHRHGIRATDAAIVDADGAQANNCAADGLGYSVYAYMCGLVNFVNGSATGNLGTAALLAHGGGSIINANGATITGAANRGIYVQRGGEINAIEATVTGSGLQNFINEDGFIYRLIGDVSGAVIEPQAVFISAGNGNFIPDADGLTNLRIDTEASAPTDDLDTLTPIAPYTITDGHIVHLRSAGNSRDPVIRNQATSGATGNYAFRTAGGASVTLANSFQVASFMWVGTGWAQLGYSAN